MVTGQTLLIDWEIRPSISVRMKISLVSWIVSTETDPKAGRESPPGTSPGFLHQLTRVILNQLKRPPWSIWPSRQFSSWPWGQARVEVRYMLGKTEILDTSPTGQGVPVPVTQLSPQESAGQRGSRQCGPRGITALAPTLDRSLKSDRSLCPVRALRYYLDRTSGRIRRWFLSPLRKVLTKTSHLPLSPLGSSRLWSYVMSSLTWRPTLYIRLKPMMSGPLMLLRSSSRKFP